MFGTTPGSWLVRGYVDAVERFREQAAIGADSPREVYPPLFEALNWAQSLWDTSLRLVEPQDRHLDGLRYVRDRCHHQLAPISPSFHRHRRRMKPAKSFCTRL